MDQFLGARSSLVAIPCNTAHLFFDEYSQGIAEKLPHICQITAKVAYLSNAQRVLVLASRSIIKSEVYHTSLKGFGIEALDLTNESLSPAVIEAIKQGTCNDSLLEKLNNAIDGHRPDAVILGCTEFSVIRDKIKSAVLIDSSYELAKFCLDAVRGKE